MKYKKTVKYLLTGMSMMFNFSQVSGGTNDNAPDAARQQTDSVIVTPPDTIKDMAVDSAYVYVAPYAIGVAARQRDVTYIFNDGRKSTRRGGTRAWRNNNPGCIRYSDLAMRAGAIGQAGGFAVFPDEATGMDAIAMLLRSDKYVNLTIAQAITKYAPPHENNTALYQKKIARLTGLAINTRIRDLTQQQLYRVVEAIRAIEGWIPGKEIDGADGKYAAALINKNNMSQQRFAHVR